MGHIVEGGLHALDGEQLARRREHALPVALGVLAQAAARFVNHGAQFSDVALPKRYNRIDSIHFRRLDCQDQIACRRGLAVDVPTVGTTRPVVFARRSSAAKPLSGNGASCTVTVIKRVWLPVLVVVRDRDRLSPCRHLRSVFGSDGAIVDAGRRRYRGRTSTPRSSTTRSSATGSTADHQLRRPGRQRRSGTGEVSLPWSLTLETTAAVGHAEHHGPGRRFLHQLPRHRRRRGQRRKDGRRYERPPPTAW